MIFVSSGKHEPPRATRITNRRWAFSALGAAAAATLTTRDTVYCCLPLHHPSGTLVAARQRARGGARLALASRFEPQTFWDEVRRYGVSVVYYAGEMCRRLVDAPPVLGEKTTRCACSRARACAPTCGAGSSIGSARSACSSSTRRPRRTPSRERLGQEDRLGRPPAARQRDVAVAA